MKRASSCAWWAAVAVVVGGGAAVAQSPASLPTPTLILKKSDPPATVVMPAPNWPPPVVHGDHAAKGGHAEPGHAEPGHGKVEHAAGHAAEAEAKVIFNADYFLLAPRRRGQDYAIVGTSVFGPVGVIKSVEGSYDSGFRIGAGYRFAGEGTEVLFNYTHYHTAGDDGVLRAPAGQNIFATLTHPTGIVQVNSAKADNNINFNLFDLEVGKRVAVSEHLGVRGFAGLRFANLDQKFGVTYTGGDVTTDIVRRSLTFDGGGLRAGGEVTYECFQHVGLYFRGSASLMTGRFRSQLSEVGNGVSVVNVDERFNKVIPIVDMGIGLRFEKGPLRVSVGYEFMNWFGALEGFDFTDDAHPAKMTRRSGDLGFDGVVFRLEYLF